MEMALLGSLILIATGITLNYLQQLNNEQRLAMEAFRRSQELTGGAGSGSYQILENYRYIDLSGGFWRGNRSGESAGASVLSGVGYYKYKIGDAEGKGGGIESKGDLPSSSIYRVNEDEIDLGGAEVEDIETEANENFQENFQKSETPAGIRTQRSSLTQETITTIFKDASGNEITRITQSLDSDRKYRAGGSGFSKSRTLEVGH